MSHNTSLRNYLAPAAIAAFRLVKFGANPGEVAQATAATEALMGVTTLVAPDVGERVDLVKSGLADVTYGGTVAAGDPLTSDGSGKAIKATVAGSRLIGFAEVAGVAGDVGLVDIHLGTLALAA
jgi:hypothetical protein